MCININFTFALLQVKEEVHKDVAGTLTKLTSPARIPHYRGMGFWALFASTFVESMVACG